MLLLVLTTVTAFLLSLLSRLLIESLLTERISIVGDFIVLQFLENTGIAFGIVLPSPLQEILIAIALFIIICLAHCYRRGNVQSVGFGLIIGGAIANIVDRLGDGLVTDFIQVGFWPVFNVADSCITVGVGLLLLYEWRKNPKYEI